MAEQKKTRVLILGGGFGGTYAALEMEKRLARRSDVEVILVDRQNFMLFTPMLHEVAASDLEITTIVSPIRQLLKHVTFLCGSVSAIDLNARTVVVSHLANCEQNVLNYDYLLLALGAQSNFYGLPGLEENAFTMGSLKDAVYLRNAMIESLEEAEFDVCTNNQRPLLTFLAAGGGFAGVETVAAMNDFVRESIRFYPHLTEEMVKVVLVHDGSMILPEVGNELGSYALKKLRERKVEVILETKVKGYGKDGVELSNGTTIKTVIFVWTAGVRPNALVSQLPVKHERGRVVVDDFMELPEFPGVFASGDCAYIKDPKSGKPYPPTAQHASREAVIVARNIEAAITGGTKHMFEYQTMGQLAAIGRRTGVALIMGMKFSGFFAWVLWRTIYLMKLPRLEKKIRVVFDWTLDLIFSKDLVQFISLETPLVQNEAARENLCSDEAATARPEVHSR